MSFFHSIRHPAVFQKHFIYDPETGILSGRMKPLKETLDRVHGYKHVSMRDRQFRSHNVAWAIYYGEWPKHIVDHINGRRDDNRIANLRYASLSDNATNIHSLPRVKHNARTGAYSVKMMCRGEVVLNAKFGSREEAETAWYEAQKKFRERSDERPIKNPLPFHMWDLFGLGPWSPYEHERREWEIQGMDYFTWMAHDPDWFKKSFKKEEHYLLRFTNPQ